MRMRVWCGLVISVLSATIPALAEDRTLEERLNRLEEEVQQQRETIRRYQENDGHGPARPAEEPGIGPLPEVGPDLRTDKQPTLSFGSTGSGRLVYAKPFVSTPKAILLGYADIQFRSQARGRSTTGMAISVTVRA